MDGVRVLEVAIYGFVPSAGAVLADWGARVVKIEHPVTGDPMRGLAAWGVAPGTGGVTHLWELFNRGKESVGIDLTDPEGLDLLMRLVDDADVFLTNFLGPARRRLGIDVEDIRARNPRIVYGRGTGYGARGPDADAGGFDGISYWARSGAATAAMPADGRTPIGMPGPAFGDIQAGMHLAGGIAAALFQRERTGEAAVVDTSLFGAGLWAMQPAMAGAYVSGLDELPKNDRRHPSNPLANVSYRTADGRYIALSMLESDRYWIGFCAAIGRPDLEHDVRFSDAEARRANATACVEVLDGIFATDELAHWRKVLSTQEGQWSAIQLTREVLDDPQAEANGYIQRVDYGEGVTLPMVVSPVHFSTDLPTLSRAPEHGASTDDVLIAAGASWDDLIRLKVKGVIS
jgi:crotonobetainyl-CoA:carnitine CoA-transferase CaiB-like acyl-CoA transferase